MKVDYFDNEPQYRERLEELVVNNYEILTHGYNSAEQIYWIRYFVKEYKKGINAEWF